MPEIPKPWSKQLSWGPKLWQRFGSIWTSEPKMQMPSWEHFSHFLTWFLCIFLADVTGTYKKAHWGPNHSGMLRNKPAWQVSCQVRIPSAGNRAPSDSSISDGAPGISHRSQSPALQSWGLCPGGYTALTSNPPMWKALSQLVAVSLSLGSVPICSFV